MMSGGKTETLDVTQAQLAVCEIAEMVVAQKYSYDGFVSYQVPIKTMRALAAALTNLRRARGQRRSRRVERIRLGETPRSYALRVAKKAQR